MNSPSLWGNLTVDQPVETPASILRVQADELSLITKNVVKGRVDVANVNVSGTVSYQFNLVVPALDNYVLTLFEISHEIQQSYPVHIMGLPGR